MEHQPMLDILVSILFFHRLLQSEAAEGVLVVIRRTEHRADPVAAVAAELAQLRAAAPQRAKGMQAEVEWILGEAA
jgi:hypothetical protein